MKRSIALIILVASTACLASKPRLVVLSDYFKDPDDKQSLIRLLCYANEFDIEGLIATSLAFGDGSVHPEWMRELLDVYANVQPNLQAHARDGFNYPTADTLKAVVYPGAPVVRKYAGREKGFAVPYPNGARDSRSCDPVEKWIGPGKDTPGSNHIIQVLDRDDPRPVWITVWGGAMDLAQALWKVRHERTPEEASAFVAKIRLFQVSWQDTGSVWIWENFPQLFFILCFESHRGMYAEGPASMRDEAWVNRNLRQNHGPLGGQYPQANQPGIKEGDSPSFLHLLTPGLNDPEHPEWGGWGGRYKRLNDSRNAYVDAFDENPHAADQAEKSHWSVGRWIEAANNDFAARMDASVFDYNRVNHNPIAGLNGDVTKEILRKTVRSGEWVTFDASGSSDPDGDSLRYRWWHYREASSWNEYVPIYQASPFQAELAAPRVQKPETLPVILEVIDSGTPPLTSYRRIILDVVP